MNGGEWDGERIVSEEWVETSVARHADPVNQIGWGYGYQWWRPDPGGTEVWAGMGFGGQYLIVMPEHNLIGVVNSWNLFGQPAQSPLRGLIEAMLAAVE